MPKQRSVVLNGGGDGSTFTNIRATIPCHILKVYEDGQRTHQFIYKLKLDNFVQQYTCDVAALIELFGNGRSGIIGRPPNYNAASVPPLTAPANGESGGGDIILQIKCSVVATPTIVVYEDEAETDHF